MCGIFGSTRFDTYQQLFNINQERGTFASGCFFYSPDRSWLRKNEGGYKLVDSIDLLDAEDKYQMFLGHVQAPTSSYRSWSQDTTHPFEVGDWIVAHNGILENHEDLKAEHTLKYDNPVDTYIIPSLLQDLYVGDVIRCITEVFSMIKGTFACWLYNKSLKKFYVVRSGSTLYYNDITPSISSIKTDEVSEEIEEGIIYDMSIAEGMTPVGEFKTHSPFFIL
jgi:glucosamine 6-phosphate synthetase-like amidotransferase/phosphosugar isomerase protein